MKVRICCLPHSAHNLDPGVVDRFRHIPSDGDSLPGLLLDVQAKATIWQVKARLMETTGIPPVGCNLTGSAGATKMFLDSETLYELNLSTVEDDGHSQALIFYSAKVDSKGKKGSLSTLAGASSIKRFHAPKKRGALSTDLSFATGRGLRQAVVNTETDFDVYATDKQGLLLMADQLQVDVLLEVFDESGLRFIDFEKQLEHDKATRACHVRYRVKRPGNYFVTIRMGELGVPVDQLQPIAGCPFDLAVIDVDNRAEVTLSELCLEEAWSLEMSAVLRDFSAEPEAHRRIFEEIGLHTILQMTRFKGQRIQENVATCLENLLKIDQNKVRMVSEGAVELVRKLADLSTRVDRRELVRFMGKLLALLMEQRSLRGDVVTLLGTAPIQYLLQVSDQNCHLSALRALLLMSADDTHRETVLGSGLVSTLWSFVLKSGDDIFLQRLVLRVLANLSDSVERFEVDVRGFDKIIERIGSTDSQVNVRAVHILANLTLKPEWAPKCLAALTRICGVVTAAQIRFEWEYTSMQALLEASDASEQPVIGDTTYELNFYFMRILANLLQQRSEESKQAILRAKVLDILVHFARSYDVLVKNEACRALSHFCDQPLWIAEVVKAAEASGDKMAPLITLISSSMLSPEGKVCVVAKMQELLDTTRGRAQALITNVSEAGQDAILELLQHPDPVVTRNASIVLAGIVKNEQYKSRIVRLGGSTFLNHLMLLVKEGVVEVQRSVDAGEIEWDEIIGQGVSGIVWACKWGGGASMASHMSRSGASIPGIGSRRLKQVCAVKKFKEENIAFDEEEFKSELAMMSVLRHRNIVHSLGGCTRRDNLFIISPLFRKGSLADLILHKTFKIDRPTGLQMLVDIAAGMQYLHSLNIIHRDLKAGNCLISDDWVVGVTDFGVSKMMTQEMSKAAGTPMYMGPEILNGKPYSFAADTYSFAFIVWELVARILPYGQMQPWEITREVCDKDLRPDKLNDPYDLLIEHSWVREPSKRPSFGQILAYCRALQSALETSGEAALAAAASALEHLLVEPEPQLSRSASKRPSQVALPNNLWRSGKLDSSDGALPPPTSPAPERPSLDKVVARALSPESSSNPSTSSKAMFNLLSLRSKQRVKSEEDDNMKVLRARKESK